MTLHVVPRLGTGLAPRLLKPTFNPIRQPAFGGDVITLKGRLSASKPINPVPQATSDGRQDIINFTDGSSASKTPKPLPQVISEGLQKGYFPPATKKRVVDDLLTQWATCDTSDSRLKTAQKALVQWQAGGMKDWDLLRNVVPLIYAHTETTDFAPIARQSGLDALIAVAFQNQFKANPRKFGKCILPIKQTVPMAFMGTAFAYTWASVPAEQSASLHKRFLQALVPWSGPPNIRPLDGPDDSLCQELAAEIHHWLNTESYRAQTPADIQTWLKLSAKFGGIPQAEAFQELWHTAQNNPPLRYQVMNVVTNTEIEELAESLRQSMTENPTGYSASAILNDKGYQFIQQTTPRTPLFHEKEALFNIVGDFGQETNLPLFQALNRQQVALFPPHSVSHHQAIDMGEYLDTMLTSLKRLWLTWEIPEAQKAYQDNQALFDRYALTRIETCLSPSKRGLLPLGKGLQAEHRSELLYWTSTLTNHGSLHLAQQLLNLSEKQKNWVNQYPLLLATTEILERTQDSPATEDWQSINQSLWQQLHQAQANPSKTQLQKETLPELISLLREFSKPHISLVQ